MKIQEAWSTGRSGAGVVIAVVDDGVQLNHPDLQQNVVSYLRHFAHRMISCLHKSLKTKHTTRFEINP